MAEYGLGGSMWPQGDVHGKETNRTHVSGWFEPSQFLEDGIARTGDGDCRFKLGWGVR